MTGKFLISKCVALLVFIGFFAGFSACSTSPAKQEETEKEVMDKVITKLYSTKTQEELASLTNEQAMALFSKEELKVLATKHWMFDVNVPVTVSVMRSIKQETVPFWLSEFGFKKTDMTVKNEITTYEIWQKNFGAGRVGLGMNGFEDYGLHYFVCVGPQNKSDKLVLSNFFPKNQYVATMKDGAFTYHDWDELVLEGVPESLKGDKLLTTIRGRAVETHLVGGFRATKYPSSNMPDQVLLTWSSDPATGIDIQWRTDTTVKSSMVYCREKGSEETVSVNAEKYKMEDLRLMNDRFIYRYTAKLRDLKPGTTYEYRIEQQSNWPENQTFSTESNDNNFSFIWFGDTHYSSEWGNLANVAFKAHPDAAFFTIVGDLVSDGLHRDQWDDLWEYTKNISPQRPFMCVPGNHDNRLGLGAKMYRDMFSYPLNGPEGKGLHPEQTYAFNYKNTLFLMIDATSPVEEQSSWIEEQLKNTDATWKVAFFHFPPYNWEEPYFDIQKAWVPLFDKYHVDMVFGGHLHYYMRSKPMKGGKVVDSYKDGTAYIISIGIPAHNENMTDEPYAEIRKPDGQYYQYMKITGNKLSYVSIDADGKVSDSLVLKK